MSRRRLQLTSFLMLSAFACPVMAAVPFFNARCPGGIDVHADAGGPVYVQGREAALKRFNDQYIEARDADSGVTLSISGSAGDGVQVSYTGGDGANGVCQVLGDGASQMPERAGHRRGDDDASLPQEVTCESTDQRQVSCDMDTRGTVEIVRRLSHTRCEEGQNWGLSRHSVWVNGGCRAVFRNVSRREVVRQGNETSLGSCNVRKGDQGTLITQVPVGNDYQELIIDYTDGRFMCMLRNDGQVQSLTPLKRR